MSSLLSAIRQEADTPACFGNNGTQYRRGNKTLSGEAGIIQALKELNAFVPEVLKMKEAGKRGNAVSQSTLCTTALAHGIYNDFAALRKPCGRLDKAHLRYIEKCAGLVIGYKEKASAELITALKKVGHYGAIHGLVKIGAPVFFLNDVRAIVKEPEVIPTPSPKTGKGIKSPL